jgi:N6-adenosine-specific RNA methylase IME4
MSVRLNTLEEGFGKYQWIYVDPPWRYDDSTCEGAAGDKYSTMTLEELEALQVGALSHADGAHLWLWATWPKIIDGAIHRLMPAWGFRWVGALTWDKNRIGIGRWLRGQAEVLCFGVCGDLKLSSRDIPNVIAIPRGRHSEKPEFFRELAAKGSTGRGIELFARKASEFCDRWGLEAPDESVVQGRVIDSEIDFGVGT